MTEYCWTPVYESLYRGEKRGLSHAARGVFVGLLIEAKKLNAGGLVSLPRGETDSATGVRELVGGRLDEVVEAMKELVRQPDPLVSIEGQPGRLSCRILSWSSRWVLGMPPRAPATAPPREDASSFDLKAWRQANGATQDDVAKLLDLSRSRVADVEAGRRSLRPEEVTRLRRPDAMSVQPDIKPDNVTHLSDTAPTFCPTLPRQNPDIRSDISDIQPDISGADGGARGGVSDLYTPEIREDKRKEEREARARTSPTAPTSSPTLTPTNVGHGPDAGPDIKPDIPDVGSGSGGNASPDDLLTWVRAAPCLRALVADHGFAKEWSEDTAGGLMMDGARREDARAAIAAFVTQRGAAARKLGREELVDALGRFLKSAKKHGDIARAKTGRPRSGAGHSFDDSSAKFGVSEAEAARREKERSARYMAEEVRPGVTRAQDIELGMRSGQTTEELLASWG